VCVLPLLSSLGPCYRCLAYSTVDLMCCLLYDLHNQQLLIFVFKCLYYSHFVPPVFHRYVVHNDEIHAFTTHKNEKVTFTSLSITLRTGKELLNIIKALYCGTEWL